MSSRSNNRLLRLAKLGDSLVNFIASAGITSSTGKPTGIRVKNTLLRQAWKTLFLKNTPRHIGGEDAYEALLAYAWLRGVVSLDECIKVFSQSYPRGMENALISLLRLVVERLGRNGVDEFWRENKGSGKEGV